MKHKALASKEEVPYCFSMSCVKFQGHTTQTNCRIWPKLGASGLQFEFTDGYEMLHKARNSKGEMPYCFPRSSIKFQGHMGQNITDFYPNWAFSDYRLVAAFKSLRFALFITHIRYIKVSIWLALSHQAYVAGIGAVVKLFRWRSIIAQKRRRIRNSIPTLETTNTGFWPLMNFPSPVKNKSLVDQVK